MMILFLLKIVPVEKSIVLEKKKLFKLFKDLDFIITVKTGLKTVKYFNVKLNINSTVERNRKKMLCYNMSMSRQTTLARLSIRYQTQVVLQLVI